jgi:hypothetical protein
MKKMLIPALPAACFLILFYTAGCGSAEKQVFRARQIFDKYPVEAAKYCGDKFPVTDSIIRIKADTLKGKMIDYRPQIESLTSGLDSANQLLALKQSSLAGTTRQLALSKALIDKLSARLQALQRSYQPCVADTIKSTIVKIRNNTAKIDALTLQLMQSSAENGKLVADMGNKTAIARRRLWTIIGLYTLIAGYLGWKVYRFFCGGAVAGMLSKFFRK